MENIIAQLINGLAIGSTYALIVLGMNLVVLVRGVVLFNFAHIVVISMAAGWIALQHTGNNLILASLTVMVAAIVLTTITEPLFRPLSKRMAFLETVVLALGLGIIITEIMSHFINQGAPITFPSVVAGGGGMLRFGTIVFSLADAYALAGCFAAVFVLITFLYKHRYGRAIRAMAQDLNVARMLGIPFGRTGIYGFMIAGALAGISALLMAMSQGSTSAEFGEVIAIKAVVLMLFAGMGNLMGGVVCTLAMGIFEAMALAYLPGRWTEAVFFGTIMIAILFKPQGIFGSRT